MTWKSIVTEYLTFTRKDRIGIVVIIFLLLAIILLPEVIAVVHGSAHPMPDTAWIAAMKKLEQKEPIDNDQQFPGRNDDYNYTYQDNRLKTNYPANRQEALFYFDPNTLSPDGWKKLGVREKTIRTIQNYLGKGGHFKRSEDLMKVYGLHEKEYKKLSPFINIKAPESVNTNKNPVASEISADRYPSKTPDSHYTVIDINTADTSAFISLPGIGSRLGARIVNFRDKLGGFYSVLQVAETFGLPDSTFQKIRKYLELGSLSIKKININTATPDELKTHPYIKWSIANPLIAYRNEHGPFSKLEDIKKVMAVTDDIYNKIAPYLAVQ